MVHGKSLGRAGEASVGTCSRLPSWCSSVSRADILDPHVLHLSSLSLDDGAMLNDRIALYYKLLKVLFSP